ncbi:hypothetical protein V8G54_036173 [Vigna mungo]|uniref:WAT1-related protein n=1 Tax=Vigna mungo TaxID=3915 RepID=A0AAQ3MHY5_VIGMU
MEGCIEHDNGARFCYRDASSFKGHFGSGTPNSHASGYFPFDHQLLLIHSLVQLLKVFPLRYWGTMLSCVIAAIQAGILGVCIDSSKAAWRLEWNVELGALATAATFCIISWAIRMKGPTYPSMFNPLSLIFVAFSEALVLGQPLTFGTNEKKGITQQPIVAAAEVSNISDLIAGAESTATVVPSSSPLNTLDLEHDSQVLQDIIRANNHVLENDCRAMAGYALVVASTALQSHCQWVSPYHTHEVSPFRALEHTGSLQD